MTWNAPRSPIHGLGRCDVANACSTDLLSEVLSACHVYGQRAESARVTGMPPTKPPGTATVGAVLPRERAGVDIVPCRVRARSAGRSGSGATGPIEIVSSQPTSVRRPAPGARVSTTRSRTPATTRPATASRATRTRFHWSGWSAAPSCWARGSSATPYWSRTPYALRSEPSSRTRSSATASAANPSRTSPVALHSGSTA